MYRADRNWTWTLGGVLRKCEDWTENPDVDQPLDSTESSDMQNHAKSRSVQVSFGICQIRGVPKAFCGWVKVLHNDRIPVADADDEFIERLRLLDGQSKVTRRKSSATLSNRPEPPRTSASVYRYCPENDDIDTSQDGFRKDPIIASPTSTNNVAPNEAVIDATHAVIKSPESVTYDGLDPLTPRIRRERPKGKEKNWTQGVQEMQWRYEIPDMRKKPSVRAKFYYVGRDPNLMNSLIINATTAFWVTLSRDS